MGGNVREWVGDWYIESYYASSPKENPLGPTSGRQRVARGGAFTGFEFDVRANCRWAYDLAEANSYLGFRCARSARAARQAD